MHDLSILNSSFLWFVGKLYIKFCLCWIVVVLNYISVVITLLAFVLN